MQTTRQALALFALLLVLICIHGCESVRRVVIPEPLGAGKPALYPTRLSPAQQYAGEVLAYMIQVVTGHAGQPALREAWRACGVNSGLRLKDISDILSDPARDNRPLMLYDMNVRGLSQVLYHYDPRLNQFKGAYAIDGVYPSAELIALRLLLVDMIAQERKADLDALYRLISSWTATGDAGSRIETNAAGLTAPQLELLRSALLAEPDLADYLRHPFLVDALDRVGVLQDSGFVRHIIRRANYRGLRTMRPAAPDSGRAVIAIMPSVVGGYRFDDQGGGLNAWGFAPDPEYTRAVDKMKQEITAAAQKASSSRSAGVNPVVFLDFVPRPLVVHPGNADAVVADLCPEADIVIVILGKNVDRSLYIDANHDIFPSTNRYYFDIMDVKYERIAEAITEIGRAVAGNSVLSR